MVYPFPEEDKEYLTEKLAIVGELAAGMAHEIRNPLTSIRGFLQLLQNKFDPQGVEREYFTIIFEELDRINNIIKEFLSLAKPAQPQLQFIAFNQLVAEALLLAEQEAIMYDVKLIQNLSPELPLLCLDPGQMKQVILNLTSNAIQATGPGGIVIISSYFDAANRQVVTTVEDNGPGIPPEKLNLIFEPFYTTKENGTGLGLTLSRRIVASHGGKILVTSKVGEGSRFTICLPVTLNGTSG
ncbi:Signal transduction histidine-protein kinase AtoS [Moorella humiferrea]|uniref:histidine kinase n=1 Tax=Neomoorella humiferrea TaxID=676965 RepID=A0A2T0AXK1_9FIRM|nr:ATP-binding protein [Moorella humiferrea]PRR75533.1 Sensor protein ZraS [Moorella humiferrea]